MDFRLPESLIFLELCNPFSSSIPGSISEDSWSYISQLAQLHGVTPFLYYRTKTLGISLPPQVTEEWRRSYLVQIAKEVQARRQMKEINEVLASQKIPIILLKGASAMLRLYPDPGLRTFCDLDILIPDHLIPRFKEAMMKAGYKPLNTMNSPEDEILRKLDMHLDPLGKEKTFMIEPHVNIFRGRGDQLTALPEIWRDREETDCDGDVLGHLSKEHFIIHTLFHCIRDLPDQGFVPMKGFVDTLYGLKTRSIIDWPKFWDTAQRWGVEKDILPAMGTLNHYWKADVPLPGKAIPLDIQVLILGIRDKRRHFYAKIATGYIGRLIEIRELPDNLSRFRFILHLFFPTPENLCCRYNLSSKKSLMSYYFLHLFLTSRKFFTGLWHQFSYHPRV